MLEKYMKRETPIYNGATVGTFDNNITISLTEALQKDGKLYDLWNESAPGSHSNESELDISSYLIDRAHPNSSGMEIISNKIISEMLDND